MVERRCRQVGFENVAMLSIHKFLGSAIITYLKNHDANLEHAQ
ncbi:MAG: hypothetical protein ACJAUZ_001015 [Flavobacteriaceae bacterium]|jgi:hypothetical protein